MMPKHFLGTFNALLWPHHESVYELFILLSLLSDTIVPHPIFHREKKECRKLDPFQMKTSDWELLSVWSRKHLIIKLFSLDLLFMQLSK